MKFHYWLFFFCLITIVCCQQKPTLILFHGEEKDELHQENAGRITFMQDAVEYADYAASDFLDFVELGEDKNVNLRMFLDRTLTSYLHELDTSLTVEELCAHGNFQVSFIVDDELIHQENLNPGAGSPDWKNWCTIYRIPLSSTLEEDHWGRFLWMRFMYRSEGQMALENGEHKLRIEVRPYLDFDDLKIGNIIAEGDVKTRFVEKDIVIEEERIAIQEIQPNSGWEISTKPFNSELIKDLNKKIAQQKFKDITSIVVVSDGELLIEEYFNETNRATRHDTRSVGKSFMSAIMGCAIDDGYIKNENQALGQFYDLKNFDNYSIEKENVTIKSLLTMSSGFLGDDGDMDNPGNEEYMYPTKNWVKFGLDKPVHASTGVGETWKYFTAGSVILGDIIHRAVPGGLEAYAEEAFFKKLGIHDYQWQYTPQKVANTAGGIQLNALDLARFGQLYKDQGQFKGQQILPPTWVEKSMAHHIELPSEIKDGFYGYQFWHRTFEVDGKPHAATYCSGTGGNKIYIFHDLPIVVVITAKAYRLPQAHMQVKRMMDEYILPAITG